MKKKELTPEHPTYSVVVVGGGWAGFSAADAISKSSNVQVHLLDASPRGPGGLAAGWRTKDNRSVEAGVHGFWRQYTQTFQIIEDIGLNIDDVLTQFTPSVLVSSSGKVAVAPVMGRGVDGESKGESNPTSIARLLNIKDADTLKAELASLLPPPLDLALLADFDESSSLTTTDRVTGLGLLGAWADFRQEDPESWLRYDCISAENLFRSVASVSPTLYREIVSPLLHVLPMTPGYDCSAAAALSCFHVFALQTRGAFDVRWCRGSITEKIFNPWVEKLSALGNVHVRGASKVTTIEESNRDKRFIVTLNDGEQKIECDAIVLAVGATTARGMIDSCPALPSNLNWKDLRGVTCVAVRVFLKKEVGDIISGSMAESPVVVCGPSIGEIPTLLETGFCIYDLGQLQDEFIELATEGLSTFEIDFFRANDLAGKSDDEILGVTLNAISSALAIDLKHERSAIIDYSVVRASNAVTHFCVGSAKNSPPIRLKKGLYVCGDWVDRTGHASWSTEKAVVTGRQAAKAFGVDFALSCQETAIIPVAEDTRELKVLREIASIIRKAIPRGLPPSPWSILSRFFYT